MTTYGTKQHRVPAALTGRFGHREPGQRWREATIAAHDLESGRTITPSSESFNQQTGAYDYSAPGKTLDAEWQRTEAHLMGAVEELLRIARHVLEHGPADLPTLPASGPDPLVVIERYLAEIGVRQRGLDEQAKRKGFDGDEVQDVRARLLDRRRRSHRRGQRDIVLLANESDDDTPLLTTDLGWFRVHGAETGEVAPLDPHLAVFMRADPPDTQEDVGFAPLPDYVDLLRDMAYDRAPSAVGRDHRWVIGHPDDPALS